MKYFLLTLAFLATTAVMAQNTFPTTGNVGIGTANPIASLQLGTTNGEINSKQIYIPGTYNFEGMKLGQIGNGNQAIEMVNHNGWNTSYGMKILVDIDHGGTGLQFQYAPPQSSYAELVYTTGMMMTAFGDVGIGTTNPQAKLNIVSLPGGADGGALIIGEINKANLRMGVNTDYSWLQSHGSLPLRINELGNNVLMNLRGGNVGIGTTTPQEKLSVNGNIRAKEIKVETSNWPDYVFEEDYKITSLMDLEKYIKINKHLPDMPSAKEVENEGLELGEMNKLLLKKVEELTLYMIELKKENQLQKQDIEELKKSNKR